MSPRIGTWLAAGLLTLLAAPAGIALAEGHGTPDHVTPAVETMCAKTKGGPAYGLCVAYCEAQDCDIEPGKRSCVELRRNYDALTGSATFPCDDTEEELK